MPASSIACVRFGYTPSAPILWGGRARVNRAWLRSEFPRLLQEDPRFSAEVVGIRANSASDSEASDGGQDAGWRFLVEVKSVAEPEDVLVLFRKVQFAESHLGESFEKLIIAPFADEEALRLARSLGIPILPADGEPEA